jgi:peroxiredoxin
MMRLNRLGGLLLFLLLWVSTDLHASNGQTLSLPPEVTEQIKKTTLLFYFSPSCSHCQKAAPEVVSLVRERADLNLLAVSSGNQSKIYASEFAKRYNIRPSELFHDQDRMIATAIGARATPVLLVLEPGTSGPTIRKQFSPYIHGQRALVEMALSDDPLSVLQKGHYVSDATCGSCHQTAYDSWQLTRHSMALLSLVRANSHLNNDCVGCHVTGQHEPTGYEIDKRPHLANVGCEACHSASGPHDGNTVDPKSQCINCHDEKHSLDFSVARGMPFIDHNLINTLPPDEVASRRRAIYDGTHPRAIASFSEGETVGSNQCASCHPAEVERWRDSPHGTAMSTLQASNHQEDIACVTCHATQRKPGPPTKNLADYRTDESVGCEACHGPADAHIAAKGAPNTIQGLGESCPVCIIEALCTSCHTPKEDPLWSLERGLQGMGH